MRGPSNKEGEDARKRARLAEAPVFLRTGTALYHINKKKKIEISCSGRSSGLSGNSRKRDCYLSRERLLDEVGYFIPQEGYRGHSLLISGQAGEILREGGLSGPDLGRK